MTQIGHRALGPGLKIAYAWTSMAFSWNEAAGICRFVGSGVAVGWPVALRAQQPGYRSSGDISFRHQVTGSGLVTSFWCPRTLEEIAR